MREELAWAAGLFEGEGSVCVRRSQTDRGMVAKIKMADEDVIRRFFKIIKVGNVTGPYFAPKKKPVWVWQTGSFEGVQHTVASLWPWLCSRRREQARYALTTHHARRTK